MAEIRKGTRTSTSANSPVNAIGFMIESAVKGMVNTAIPVRVDSVSPGGVGPVGHLSATPLVQQFDGFGNAIPATKIPKLPYSRIQGGAAALIIDPKPGDIGIAVFAQQDISGVGKEPTKPASFRAFSMADGMYIGGIMNDTPTVYIEIDPSGTVNITAPAGATVTSPDVTCSGNVTIEGDARVKGSLVVDGQVNGAGINLTSHVHSGVQSGPDKTGGPE